MIFWTNGVVVPSNTAIVVDVPSRQFSFLHLFIIFFYLVFLT